MCRKTSVWIFLVRNWQNLTWEDLTKKGILKRETESLLIAAQNNAIKTNYNKVKINNMQLNSECRLCGNKNIIINLIISKLVEKEIKTTYDWVRKVIHWELGKKLKFEHTYKWYLHKPESVQVNEMQKILGDFEIQMVLINKIKKTSHLVDFAILVHHRVKIKKNESPCSYVESWKKL